MDGVPAPLSMFTPPESRDATRAVALQILRREWGYKGRGGGGGGAHAQRRRTRSATQRRATCGTTGR